jgi:hypothetical protein
VRRQQCGSHWMPGPRCSAIRSHGTGPRTGDWALPAAQHSPVSWAGADRMRRREGAIDEGGFPDGRPA